MSSRSDNRSDIGPGQVEWLDLGPADPIDPVDRQRRSRRPWYLAAAALVISVMLVAAVNHDTTHKTASPSHPPSRINTETGRSSPAPASPTASPTVEVTSLGHRLLDVPADWELFARGPDWVVRIELARGRVTKTTVPSLADGAGVSFVVGSDRVLALTLGGQGGYLVPDGRASRELPAPFNTQGPVLPGPDPEHVWVQTGNTVTLVGFDGRRAGPSIRVPDGIGTAASDGAGYVRFYATGGVYDARPDGVRRITAGALLATGPTRWLTEECDAQFHCATTVIDRASGARRTLAGSEDKYSFGGFIDDVISPDGTVAALLRDDGHGGQVKVQLLDLDTGDRRDTSVLLNPETAFNGGGTLAWTPDSRWLFVAADAGRVLALDRRSMRTTTLLGSLAFVSQVGLRTG